MQTYAIPRVLKVMALTGAVLAAAAFFAASQSLAIETPAKYVYMVDANTGTVLM